MREQVCKYMCPYARFQSVMFDRDTLTITYDVKRGEPRGPRSKKVDRHAAGLGDCIDCLICVQVCPVGIDIRKGLQYECIGCAACVDGCNQVMDKMGYPPGLIRYTIVGAAAGSLAMRNPLKVDVIRDRGALAREVAPGVIENVYRVQVMNTDETPRQFTVRAEGLPGLKVVGIDQPIGLGAAQTSPIALRLQLALDGQAGPEARSERAHDQLGPGTHKIELIVQAVDDDKVVRHEKTSFIIPR